MVAAVGSVGVARRRHPQPRAPAEFADRDDQRFLQQAALVHVFEQCRQAAIQLRTMQVLQGPEVCRVRIPGAGLRIAIGHRRPVHLHELRASLDQPARHQQTLPKGVQTVPLAHRGRFLLQIHGVARLAR